jgi:hypothetical protein
MSRDPTFHLTRLGGASVYNLITYIILTIIIHLWTKKHSDEIVIFFRDPIVYLNESLYILNSENLGLTPLGKIDFDGSRGVFDIASHIPSEYPMVCFQSPRRISHPSVIGLYSSDIRWNSTTDSAMTVRSLTYPPPTSLSNTLLYFSFIMVLLTLVELAITFYVHNNHHAIEFKKKVNALVCTPFFRKLGSHIFTTIVALYLFGVRDVKVISFWALWTGVIQLMRITNWLNLALFLEAPRSGTRGNGSSSISPETVYNLQRTVTYIYTVMESLRIFLIITLALNWGRYLPITKLGLASHFNQGIVEWVQIFVAAYLVVSLMVDISFGFIYQSVVFSEIESQVNHGYISRDYPAFQSWYYSFLFVVQILENTLIHSFILVIMVRVSVERALSC